jgi:circadian clock protein KaiB
MKSPLFYKGLALFTPGGDLVYCIDPHKQGRWHLQLCMALQDLLQLPDPPLFLIPCYTATVDRWCHSHHQQVRVCAEAHSKVWQYRWLLNLIFDTSPQSWDLMETPENLCDPLVLSSYRQQFPQLWDSHNLVIQLNTPDGKGQGWERSEREVLSNERAELEVLLGDKASTFSPAQTQLTTARVSPSWPQGYVLRLFVAGSKHHTAHILKTLHQLLDHALNCPYTLNVIDVIKRPDLAEVDQVAATPTLLRVWPYPVRKLVGVVDQPAKVLHFLQS